MLSELILQSTISDHIFIHVESVIRREVTDLNILWPQELSKIKGTAEHLLVLNASVAVSCGFV